MQGALAVQWLRFNFKNLQMEDQQQIFDKFLDSMDHARQVTEEERRELQLKLSQQYFPFAENVIQKNLSLAHNKIRRLENIEGLKSIREIRLCTYVFILDKNPFEPDQ